VLSAQNAQAARHIWLNHTLGLLKPRELALLAGRRGWPVECVTMYEALFDLCRLADYRTAWAAFAGPAEVSERLIPATTTLTEA